MLAVSRYNSPEQWEADQARIHDTSNVTGSHVRQLRHHFGLFLTWSTACCIPPPLAPSAKLYLATMDADWCLRSDVGDTPDPRLQGDACHGGVGSMVGTAGESDDSDTDDDEEGYGLSSFQILKAALALSGPSCSPLTPCAMHLGLSPCACC